MKEGKELADAIMAVYEKHRFKPRVSPIDLSLEAMRMIRFPRNLHDLGWIGCNLHLRQLARAYLRRKCDPTRVPFDDEGGEDFLFSGLLQDRYPIAPKHGEQPVYVLRAILSPEDRAYNVARLRRASLGFSQHADALEAEGQNQEAA